MPMQPSSLRQRIIIYVLIPVFMLLTLMGFVSFIFARNAILKQWSETAIARLQRAAHLIDMRLSKPKNMLLILKEYSDYNQNRVIRRVIIDQLKKSEGVVKVNFDFSKDIISGNMSGPMHGRMAGGPGRFKRNGSLIVSLPKYNTMFNSKTITISTDFRDKNGNKIGYIEVIMSFDDLIDQITGTVTNIKAFLIDDNGHILSGKTVPENKNTPETKRFGKSDPLEIKTLNALNKSPSGTIFGDGYPPKEISGYYRLKEAPWTFVLIAPGKEVLKDIINFKNYYFAGGFIFIIFILVFIRIVISNTTRAIKKVSDAAKDLANGIFGEPLPVLSKDEVGELTRNFNKMTEQLEERMRLKAAMNLAKEVQENLLPPANHVLNNIEISGMAVYCDETGGDYFDIIKVPDEPDKILVAVGDVVDHGIGAALLMATSRALVRGSVGQKQKSLSQKINDVNRLLFMDTSKTGSFVTMFFLEIDALSDEIIWIRGGHEPAIVYSPTKNKFDELKGKGLVLGFDEDWNYNENRYKISGSGTIVLIYTDGACDVENKAGERFGKDRIKRIIEKNYHLSSKDIIRKILSEIEIFRGKTPQNDDITLMMIKFP